MTDALTCGMSVLRQRCLLAFVLFAAMAGAPACMSPLDDASSGAAVSEVDATSVVDLHALDIWAQPLEEAAVTVDGRAVRADGDGRVRILLGGARSYRIGLAAPDHVPLDVALDYDGSTVAVRDPSVGPDGGRAGVGIAHGKKRLTARTIAGHDLFLGLRHKWFSAQGRPARRGNDVRLLMDGEEAYRDIHARLKQARSEILVSTWWWDSSFELVRDDPMAPASARRNDTILKTLEASPADKRVLVGQLLGSKSLLSWMTSDSGLRAHVNDPRFQFMREGNDARGRLRFEVESFRFGDRVKERGDLEAGSTLEDDAPIASTVPPHEADLTTFIQGVDLASVHQKFAVVDGATAYIGGMNLRETDWDTSEHEVFDPRRLPFDASNDVRSAVADKVCPPTPEDPRPMTCPLPQPGPRKDYVLRIDGPAVADASDVFERRWNGLIDRGAGDAAGRTRMAALEGDRGAKGSVHVQVTATMPAPYGEHAIAETWFNAVRNAERFIYVEDQYFRIPMLHDDIARRMDEVPDLKLVVVTKPMSSLDPGCAQTSEAYRFFAQRYPERFLYLTLRAFDAAGGRYGGYADIDVHAKMLVVDDEFMSVGSANKNNRGLVYEYELNAAVHDKAWVRAARKRMLKNVMPDAPETDDAGTWFQQLRSAAAENQRRYDANQNVEQPIQPPVGFVFPLGAPPKSCSYPNVGPDAT